MVFWKDNDQSPADDPSSLGNVVKKFEVSQEEIDAALQAQAENPDLRLGAQLVMQGVITKAQLEMALTQQQVHRARGDSKKVRELSKYAIDRGQKASQTLRTTLDEAGKGLLQVADKLK